MTKLELHYPLVRPLTEDDAGAVANVHSWYGILHVLPSEDDDSVTVEYDASRLSEKDVEAVLHRFGIPIRRQYQV